LANKPVLTFGDRSPHHRHTSRLPLQPNHQSLLPCIMAAAVSSIGARRPSGLTAKRRPPCAWMELLPASRQRSATLKGTAARQQAGRTVAELLGRHSSQPIWLGNAGSDPQSAARNTAPIYHLRCRGAARKPRTVSRGRQMAARALQRPGQQGAMLAAMAPRWRRVTRHQPDAPVVPDDTTIAGQSAPGGGHALRPKAGCPAACAACLKERKLCTGLSRR
jgi:hypothetical protein